MSSLSGEELSRWAPLCRDAMDEIALCADEKDPSDETAVRMLSNLAGVLAYYKYCLYSHESEKSVTLGSLKIDEKDSRAEFAKALFEKEREAASEYLKLPSEVCFQRVVI